MTYIPIRRYCKPAFVLTCALLACALLAGALQTGPVYKYRLPDGRIVYTSDKIPNAKLLDTLPEPGSDPAEGDPRVQPQPRNSSRTTSSISALRASSLSDLGIVGEKIDGSGPFFTAFLPYSRAIGR